MHSVWYPTIQLTCRIGNPRTGENVWRSVNVSNFTPAPSGLDRRSCKADQFSITHKAGGADGAAESFTLTARYDDDLQVSLNIARPASIPGFKIGRGPQGGYSYFGASSDPSKADGYVIHRFWPRTLATGAIVYKGAARSLDKRPGMFVHAIQGMRPNLVASRWNFAHFQSDEAGGAAAVQMEFTTIAANGLHGAGSGGVRVNVGALVLGNKLAAVTAETALPGESLPPSAELQSRAEHIDAKMDPHTGYAAPTGLLFTWAAPSLVADASGPIRATLAVDVGGPEPATAKGLIEKVDVLAEIPYVLKTVVNYVAGTKPYIYQASRFPLRCRCFAHPFMQWVNEATLAVTGPESLVPGGSAQLKGLAYNESTFISE
jgi:hypothetical protein